MPIPPLGADSDGQITDADIMRLQYDVMALQVRIGELENMISEGISGIYTYLAMWHRNTSDNHYKERRDLEAAHKFFSEKYNLNR